MSPGLLELVSGIVTIIIALVIVVLPFWKIFSKAGFSGWLSLLMFIPLANLIMIWYLAFAKWPALDSHQPENEELTLLREKGTAQATVKLNARQVVKDIRGGLDDAGLMARYGLSPAQVKKLFERLLEHKLVTSRELAAREKIRRNGR